MYAVKSAHCSPRYTVIGIRIVLVVYCYNFFTGRGSSAVIVENDKLFYCWILLYPVFNVFNIFFFHINWILKNYFCYRLLTFWWQTLIATHLVYIMNYAWHWLKCMRSENKQVYWSCALRMRHAYLIYKYICIHLCVCICVCMYVCMYVRVCMYGCACIHAYRRVCTYAYFM